MAEAPAVARPPESARRRGLLLRITRINKGSIRVEKPPMTPIRSALARSALARSALASVAIALGVAYVGPGGSARAANPVTLTLKDHQFTPSHVEVPANQRFRIEVTNRDDVAGEFESHDMKFEKIMAPGSKISVYAGPLHPGTYKFFDDYHPDTATGTITAKAE
jgi:heme/copper-type cytochrome/quinol oxidase subunit 2